VGGAAAVIVLPGGAAGGKTGKAIVEEAIVEGVRMGESVFSRSVK
jgi:hypothetical protein